MIVNHRSPPRSARQDSRSSGRDSILVLTCSGKLSRDRCLNSATRIENPFKLGVARFCGSDQVIKYPVHDIFVKDPLVTKGQQILFQALQFETVLIRGVTQRQDCKIRKPRFRADTGKFRKSHDHDILSIRVFIRKSLNDRSLPRPNSRLQILIAFRFSGRAWHEV